MKKRLLSLLLTAMMLICMMPAQAFSIEENGGGATGVYAEELPESQPADTSDEPSDISDDTEDPLDDSKNTDSGNMPEDTGDIWDDTGDTLEENTEQETEDEGDVILPLDAGVSISALTVPDVTVYVSISVEGQYVTTKYGKTLVRLPVKVPADTDEVGVLKEAHRLYHADGGSGYSESGGWFSKFWGQESYFIGYFKNGKMVMSPSSVSEGDDIEGMIYNDYISDVYARFDVRQIDATAGENVTLTLYGIDIFSAMGGDPLSDPVKYATIWQGTADASGLISWTDTGTKTNTDGKATVVFSNAGTYYMSAKSDDGSLLPAVCVIQVTGALTDYEKDQIIDSDKTALTLPLETEVDLVLPSKGASGRTSISWSSSNTSVLSDDGLLTPPAVDTDVTMTATISFGGRSDTKDFTVKAKALSRSAAQAKLDAAKAVITGASFTAYEYDSGGYGENLQDKNIIYILQARIDADANARGVTLDRTLTVDDSSGTNFKASVATDGIITYPSIGGSAPRTGQVTVSLSISYGSLSLSDSEKSGVITIARRVALRQATLDAEVAKLTFSAIQNSSNGSNSDADSITTNLKLPTSSGSYVSISWNSSDPDVISNYGTVTRPPYGSSDAAITLTATVSINSMGSYLAGPAAAPQTVTINVTVKAYTDAELGPIKQEVDNALAALTPSGITYMGGDVADLSAVLYNLQLKDPRGSISGATFEWTSSNSAITINYLQAVVSRPAIDGADVSGQLIVTLSKAGYSASKAIDVTVKAMTQDELDEATAYMNAVKDALIFDVIKRDNVFPYAVTGNLQMVYRGYYDGDTVTWATSNSGYTGIEITWESSNTGVIATYGTVTKPQTATAVTMTATLKSLQYAGFVENLTVPITVTVLPAGGDVSMAVLENIAGYYAASGIAGDQNAPWLAADFAAFEAAFPAFAPVFSGDQQEAFLVETIGKAETATLPGDLAKYIIALRALGYDARYVTTMSGDSIDLVSKLTALVDSNDANAHNIYTLPYVLMALQQHGEYATPQQIDSLVSYALGLADEVGGWGGEFYFEDATSTMISALAPYYNSDTQVKAAIDKALARLEGAQNANGDIGQNAASTGLVMAAFSSIGKNPASIKSDEKSLVDGLLNYLTDDGDAFTGYLGTADSFSTEQGFRGLLSFVRTASTGNAYHIYDFASNPAVPVSAVAADNCPVFFTVIPDGASVTVTSNSAVQSLKQGVFYDLPAGEYDYTVSKEGYTSKTGSFTVTAQEAQEHTRKEIHVSLSSAVSPGNTNISVTVLVKTHSSNCNNSYTYKNNADKYQTIISQSVSLKSGSSAFDALDAALTAANIGYVEGSPGYISSIDGLYEFTHGPTSGWMYMVGSTVPTQSSRDYLLTASTTVTWFFTDDYTSEYGAETWGGGSGGGEVANQGTNNNITNTVQPDTTVSNEKSTSTVDTKTVSDALQDVLKTVEEAKAKGDNSAVGEIKLDAKATGNVSASEVKIPVSSAKEVAGAGVQITIESNVAVVTFDAAALAAATNDAGNAQEVVFTVESLKSEALSEEAKEIVGDSPVFEFTLSVDGENITDFGDGTVSVTIPYTPKDGENTEGMTVYYLAEDGTVKAMEGAKYDADSGGFVFTTNHFSKFFLAPAGMAVSSPVTTASPAANPFTDVKESDWFYNAVQYVYENGIMQGTSSSAFDPAADVTRAMLVTMLHNYESKPQTSAANPFSDVPGGQWYTTAVIWAAENNVVSGYTDGTFGTSDPLTREQIVTVLRNWAVKESLDVSNAADLSSYTDAGQISGWALEAMKWAKAEDIISGRSSDKLAPKGTATRAEVAALLMNFIEEFTKE